MQKVVLIVAIGFCVSSACGQTAIGKDQYSIYAVVIRDIRDEVRRQEKTTPRIVLLSVTMKADNGLGKDSLLMKGLSRNFAKQNLSAAEVQNKFSVQFQIDLTDKSEIRDLLERGKIEYKKQQAELAKSGKAMASVCSPFWEYFYEKFPNSIEYYQFSRIGFSTNHQFAVVETIGEGSCSNSWWWHWLKRTRHGWVVYRRTFGGSVS